MWFVVSSSNDSRPSGIENTDKKIPADSNVQTNLDSCLTKGQELVNWISCCVKICYELIRTLDRGSKIV